jgi:hypothetical protein
MISGDAYCTISDSDITECSGTMGRRLLQIRPALPATRLGRYMSLLSGCAHLPGSVGLSWLLTQGEVQEAVWVGMVFWSTFQRLIWSFSAMLAHSSF